MAKEQVHGKFKLFAGPVASDGSIGELAAKVTAFVADARIAPKSIGVEYLESAKTLLFSLGYRDDESPYGVRIETLSLGKLGKLEASDVSRLENAMGTATSKVSDIICHELFVTGDGECHMVIMRSV